MYSERYRQGGVNKMTECVDGVVRGGPVSRRMEDLCLEEKLDRALLNNPGNKTSSKTRLELRS